MFESKSNVFVVGVSFFFPLPFVVVGLLPWAMGINQPRQTLLQIAAEGITHEFIDLAERYPKQFQKSFPDGPTTATFAEALGRGHNIFIAEGCGHCHTQQFRSGSNDDLRRDHRPALFGRRYTTPLIPLRRRVGPDLIREAARSALNPASRARRSNDWHVAHFYKPTNVSPTSVMPEYSWYFDDDGYPNKDGMSLITYIQWLGSWLEEYPYIKGEGSEGPEE